MGPHPGDGARKYKAQYRRNTGYGQVVRGYYRAAAIHVPYGTREHRVDTAPEEQLKEWGLDGATLHSVAARAAAKWRI